MKSSIFAALCLPLWACATHAQEVWDLPRALRLGAANAPELRASDAAVAQSQQDIAIANLWPNPMLEMHTDNRLGAQSDVLGIGITHLAISQTLAWRSRPHATAIAQAQSSAVRAQREHERLVVENRIAHAFHALQLAQTHFAMAKEHQAQMLALIAPDKGRKDPLVRYLNPAERLRLDILIAGAGDLVAAAEGEYSEAAAHFRALMMLADDTDVSVVDLSDIPAPPSLEDLTARFARHPALMAAAARTDVAIAGIDAARSARYADPSVSIYTDRERGANSAQTIVGAGFAMALPLWHRNDAAIAKAYAGRDESEAQATLRRRDLQNRWRNAHTHAGHLIEQSQRYRLTVLQPSQRFFDVTRRGFAAGETGLLNLIDAHDNYFDAQRRYVELQYQGWLEWAALRLAAGIAVTTEAQP